MEGLSETRPHLEGIATLLSSFLLLNLLATQRVTSETRPHLEGIATTRFPCLEIFLQGVLPGGRKQDLI